MYNFSVLCEISNIIFNYGDFCKWKHVGSQFEFVKSPIILIA